LFQTEGTILTNRRIKASYYHLCLEVPAVAGIAQPGQFIHIKCGDGFRHLLRRPVSIHGIDRSRGCLELLFEVKGSGTAWLAERKGGESLDLLGPLGNGFPIEPGYQNVLLVAGGIGIAPMFCLARELRLRQVEVIMLMGAKNKEWLLLEKELKDLGIVLHIATDDGSLGHHGFVTDILPHLVSQNTVDCLYACGPQGMLAGIGKMAPALDLSCYVSLEERMACGVGACRGCVVGIKDSAGNIGYKNVCSDGPVFAVEEVVF